MVASLEGRGRHTPGYWTDPDFGSFRSWSFAESNRDAPHTAAEIASFAAAFRRGWDAANERRYHDAVTEYSAAIRLKPDDPAVYNNRAAVYQILNQFQQTIADYSEVIRLKQGQGQPLQGRS